MLLPVFQLHLGEKIQRAQATVGRYDGKHPALTCATIAGKVFLHTPHDQNGSENQISYLNINKHITAVVAGQLDPKVSRDVLAVGTPSNLQCFDIHENKDVFFKDVADGVNCVVLGKLAGIQSAMAIVGGNCSIQGFDHKGTEAFWTVTGDNVGAMCFCDINNDGRPELVVASDDFDIRVFAHEDVIAETSEADTFVALTHVLPNKFGYALANGTIGMYQNMDRVWRVKSKHSVCAIAGFDLDGDGVPELISGWSNGRMEVRREGTGEVVFRDNLASMIAAVVCADYRNDGHEQVMVCSSEGEIRGYMPMKDEGPQVQETDFVALQQIIADLTQRRQELMHETNAYARGRNPDPTTTDASAVIPGSTRVDSTVTVNREAGSCDLLLTTNNETVIRGVVVFGEQIFDEESLFVALKTPESKVVVPLRPLKDVAVVLMLKVLVGTRTSATYHVFELELELPKFAMYAPVDRSMITTPASYVKFFVAERMQRFINWLEMQFHQKASAKSDIVESSFLCLRDKLPLIIRVQATEQAALQITIHTDNIDVAGELVHDLGQSLGVTDLASTAEFPEVFALFKTLLTRVEESNATRMRMNADMADSSNLLKTLLIRAEDVRILGEMKTMKTLYRQLYDLNKDLVTEHQKRTQNHDELLEALKEVNQTIQRVARLRMGQTKAKIISAARAAIKANNMNALYKVVHDGDPS